MSEEAKSEQTQDVINACVEALKGRASFYDLLAALYFKPLSQEQIENIVQMDLSVYADVNEYFADGINDVTRYLRKRNTGTRQALAVDFTTAFGGTSSWKGRYAVPYESVFTSQEGLMFQGAYHDVYRLFREHKLQRSAGYDYPDDHLSFMCEFLAIMSDRTIEALEAGNYEEAVKNLEASNEFLDEHILSWFDDFNDLSLLLLSTRFYRGILKITKGFFLFDKEVMVDLITEIEAL